MLKVNTTKRKITPPVGTLLAGYTKDIVSDGIHDDLYVSGISLDDGENKAVLLSFDLLGMDRGLIQKIREECATVLGLQSENIILTCTHTHSGPHTRSLAGYPFDHRYSKDLINYSKEAVSDILKNMRSVFALHYSVSANENINRRVGFPDNSCSYLPLNKHLRPLATGITDPELGMVFFVDSKTKRLVATFVNYAAHPITCQSGNSSSRKITSDYPGTLRKFVEKELGGSCIFTSGACGNLLPRGFESGFERTEEMGKNLAIEVINGFSDAFRNQKIYRMAKTQLETKSVTTEIFFRKSGCIEERLPVYKNKNSEHVEIQFLRLGEICLVGVPGELLVEPGLEIKWQSPFRKTFILYNSTAYTSYIPPANAYVSGGYEADTSHLKQFSSFALVSRVVEEFKKLVLL